MILTQRYTESLSQATYLIADEGTGLAVVVDPLRDVAQYLDAAQDDGLTIVGVILTHFHADFLAGHLELAAATDAWIGVGERGRPQFVSRALADGERILLGDVVLEIMATPGHTPESISILVYESAEDEVAYGVLTGDSLFVGDVGRVDLQAIFGADPTALAHEQYDTIQRRFMSLPDAVRVFPAHGAGSSCGKNISQDRESTIGRERTTNPACQPMSAEDFVGLITTGQLPAPAYFVKDAALNRERHGLFGVAVEPEPLDADAVIALLGNGSMVLDTRDVEPFAAGHLLGALNVPLDGRFAETAGMFLDFHGGSVVLVARGGTESEAVRQLGRIGFDHVAGYLPEAVMDELDDRGQLVSTDRIDRTDFEAERLAADGHPTRLVLLDVRGPGEYADGAIPGSMNIPLPELGRRLDEIDSGSRILVNCAGGWRSGVAASYLNAHGFAAVDLRGGYEAWASA